MIPPVIMRHSVKYPIDLALAIPENAMRTRVSASMPLYYTIVRKQFVILCPITAVQLFITMRY